MAFVLRFWVLFIDTLRVVSQGGDGTRSFGGWGVGCDQVSESARKDLGVSLVLSSEGPGEGNKQGISYPQKAQGTQGR